MDQSIFAWSVQNRGVGHAAMLANSTRDFQNSKLVYQLPTEAAPRRVRITNEGVEMEAVLHVASLENFELCNAPHELQRCMDELDVTSVYFLRLACRRLQRSGESNGFSSSKVEIVLTKEEEDGEEDKYLRWAGIGIGDYSGHVYTKELGRKLITIMT
jgi:hypothetical protein